MPGLLDNGRGRLMAVLLAVALGQLAATILVARGVHLAVDAPPVSPGPIAAIAALAVCAYMLEAVQRRLCEGLGQAYVTDVRDVLFGHLLRVDGDVLQRRRHGAMLQSFVGDLTALRQWVSEGIMRGAVALLGIAGLLAWLATRGPAMASLHFALIAVAIISGVLLLRPLDRVVREVRRTRGQVAGFASERLAAAATIQVSGRISSEQRRLRHRAGKFNAAVVRRAWLTGFLRGIAPLAVALMMLATAGFAQGQTAGSLAGQFVVIGLLGVGLRDLARAGQLLIPGRVSRERLRAMLALPTVPSRPERKRKAAGGQGLVLDGLQLLPGSARISTTASAGQIVLVDGEPAHRRTLFRILAGQAVAHQGEVTLGPRRLCGLAANRRRHLVGYYSPDLPLLRASDGYNVRYRKPRGSQDEARRLAQRLGLDLAARGQSPVRVKLARALLGTPALLLLELSDPEIGPDDFKLLASELRAYPGIVLLATDHAGLRTMAARRWQIDLAGLSETPGRDDGPLRLISSQ